MATPITPQRRRRWRKDILRFRRATRGAIESFLVGIDAYPLLVMRARDDPMASALAEAVTLWASKAAAPDAHFLCLACDQEFGPHVATPAAFMVSMPFANQEHAMVTGVCETCLEHGTEYLKQVNLRRLKQIWPDIYGYTPTRAA